MRRRTVVKIVFVASCLTLFLYKTFRVFEAYWKYEIVTKIYHERQENLRMPLVCISTRKKRFFWEQNSSEQIVVEGQRLTYEEYRRGKWIVSQVNTTERQLYDQITPQLHDLVQEIVIEKTIYTEGDEYDKIKISWSDLQNLTQLSEAGLQVSRSDYYPYLKCYCLAIREGSDCKKEIFPNGVQGLYIYPKVEITVFIVPPGRFYDYNRKLSSFEIELNHTHHYVIQYGIYKLLNKHKPCSANLSYNEDDCKLKKLTTAVIALHNCTAPWFLFYNSTVNICGPRYSRDVAYEYHGRRYRPYSECENPCEKMLITTLFNSKSPGKQELQIRFARNIQITEDYIKVSLLEALANIGGYLGMILGISILDVEKVAVFLLQLFNKENGVGEEYVVEGRGGLVTTLSGRDNPAIDSASDRISTNDKETQYSTAVERTPTQTICKTL